MATTDRAVGLWPRLVYAVDHELVIITSVP